MHMTVRKKGKFPQSHAKLISLI